MQKVIKINQDMYKDIKSLEDFYESVGILDMIPEGKKFDVQKVHMNDEDCLELQEIMFKNNYRKGKFRHSTKKYLKSCCAMEWVCYSPCSSKLDVPHGELWLEEGYLINE